MLRPIAPTAPTHRGRASWFAGENRYFNALILLMLIFPIIGNCYPPETYFITEANGNIEFGQSKLMPLVLPMLSLYVIRIFVAFARSSSVRHDWFAYLYTLIAFVSVAASPEPAVSFNRALRLLPTVGLAALFGQILPRRKMQELMVWAFLITCLFSVFMVVAFPQYGGSHYEGDYSNAWRGSLSHKNTAGAVAGVGLILSIDALRLRIGSRAIALSTIFMCLLLIVKAQSMTSIVSSFVGLSVYGLFLFVNRLQPGLRLLIVAPVMIIIILAMAILTLAPEIFLEITGRDMTLTGRTDIWAAVWSLIQQKPWFGHGYGFWSIDSPDKDSVKAAIGYMPAFSHDDWLDLWLQIGIFGVLVVAFDCLNIMARGLARMLTAASTMTAMPLALATMLVVRSISEVQFVDTSPFALFVLIWCSLRMREEHGATVHAPPACDMQQLTAALGHASQRSVI